MLADIGSSVTPLLLVQVDSTEGSIEEATQWLKELGFRSEEKIKLFALILPMSLIPTYHHCGR